MKKLHILQVLLMVFFIILSISISYAQVWDLNTDWSDTVNGGIWSYRQDGVNLIHVDAWNWSNQPAWYGGVHVPVWFKSTIDNPDGMDFIIGDIVTHSTDTSNGPGMGPANVIWTSPINGTIDINGSIWATRDIGRSNHWDILLNGTSLTGGDVYSGDPYSRSNPFDFSLGSSGASALQNISVSQGDILEIRITTNISNSGDFAGVNYTISGTPVVPEPISSTLFIVGGATLGFRRFRKKFKK